MRLLCPFCQKAISVPDSEAGKAVNCPECAQQFAAPQIYTPSPAPMLPPVESRLTAPAADIAPGELKPDWGSAPAPPQLPELPQPDRELSGFARMVSVSLDVKVIRWIPAGALFLAFLLTFFSWNGLYPAGYPAYTQNAWQGVLASISRDAVADDELKLGAELDDRVRTSWWLLPYLLFLLPTLALALAGPIIDVTKLKIPPAVEHLWRFLPVVLGVLTIGVLIFLLAQWATSLGLQRAINDKIEADWADRKAQANTPDKMQRWEMNVAAQKGAFHVRTTPWLRLAVLAHLLAAIAIAAEAGLMLRGNKPAPRVGAMW
jgi:hypothetical protein